MASAIGPSTTYNDNYTKNAYASKLIAETLTDGVATFSGGTVVGLITPTDPQDAVTKAFVDGLSHPSPPTNSIQFNNLTFGGSSNLTFSSNSLILNGSLQSTSGINITGGVISGLLNPINNSEIATKNYVDSFSSIIVNTYIQSDSNVTYTASQMINGIVFRNLLTENVFNINLTDTTATASQLIAQVSNATVGYAAKFKIMNDNPDANGTTVEGRDGFVLTINPGSGVTFFPSDPFQIRRGYTFDATITFTNIITPAVTIIINSCAFSGISTYLAPSTSFLVLKNSVDYLNYNAMQNTNNILWNVNSSIKSTTNYSYTTNDIKNQITIRNPSGTSTDIFGNSISILYMNQIIIIQNISAFTINITGQTNIWTLTPTSIVIPSGYQTTLSINNSLPTLTNIGSYYNTGNYNTTGGTGSGMIITVSAISTIFTLTNGGSGYSTGNLTTTNLTTQSATGLIVNCNSVDSTTMEILGLQDIVNFLNGGYQDGDIIQINGGDGLARITLNNVNSIIGFNINTLGTGTYVIGDIINISGPGPGSNAQLTLNSFISLQTIGKIHI
jgi:hypothetical protein